MFVDFNILNQLGSPSINSNTFANRPAAGQTGRLFVSIDTFEIYRDNGTTWDLIGGPGSSTVTGTGAATQVAYWTAAQAIGGSNNLWWDNTNGYLGIKTNAPTAGVNIVQTDGQGVLSDFTTVAGSGSSAVAVYAKNTTNSSGFAAIFEERTPNSAAGQYPIKISHTLSSGTAAANMATGIHFGLPDDAGTERIMQMSTDTVDPAAATYSSRYRFLLRNAGAAATPFYITGAGIGIYKAAPSGLIHADGGANVARIILDADNNVARIFSFRTDDLQRWAFRVDGNETGTNAGADLQVRRYNDAGTFIDAPVQITRSTGHVGIGGAASSGETLKVTGSALIEHNYTQTTGVNRNGIFSYLTTTTPNGASYTAGIAYTAMGALHNDIFQGSATIPRTVLAGGLSGQAFIQFNSGPDTVTIQQGLAGQLRSFAAIQANFGFSPSQAGCTVTHASGFHAYAPIYTGANNPTVTNYYGIALNDTTEYSALTITNRWGVYQAGASDLNYFAANTLIGSTVNNGNALQVTGNSNITGNLDIGGTGGTKNLNVFGDARLLNSQPTLDFTLNINTAFSHSIVGSNYSTSPLSSNTLEFRVANGANTQATVMTLNGAGSVGIGTTNPSTKLTVENAASGGSAWTDNQVSIIRDFGNTTRAQNGDLIGKISIEGKWAGGIIDAGAQIRAYASSSGINYPATDMLFYTSVANTAAAERMRITSGGDVGINTQTPATRFNVVGGSTTTSIANAATTVTTRIDVANSAISLGIGYVAQDIPMIQSVNNGTNNATNLTINPFGGNVLVGTTTDSGARLSVKGGIIDFDGDTRYGVSRIYNSSTGDMFGLEQVSAVQTGSNAATRLFTSATGSADLVLGKYTNATSFTSFLTLSNAGNALFAGSIKTAAPTTGTAAEWKLGSRVAAAVALDATQYIELDVGGTLYKLAIVT